MKLTENTIFITGGGSGIGRALAEAFHRRGNKVIIAGRRRAQLDEVVAANPGIDAIELDIADPASIQSVSEKLIATYPKLNVLFNNAGVMQIDNAAGVLDEKTLQTHIGINLLGPIRLTSALIEHLKRQKNATILYNTSTLAFTPLAPFAVYSATKAALHSYVMSQRFLLRDTSVKVQEIAPPWVGTGLVGDTEDPRAMRLDRFVEGTMAALETDAEEVLVEEALIYRNNAGPKEHAFVTELNTFMAKEFAAA
jgi:uncharacterized oxidoreductase